MLRPTLTVKINRNNFFCWFVASLNVQKAKKLIACSCFVSFSSLFSFSSCFEILRIYWMMLSPFLLFLLWSCLFCNTTLAINRSKSKNDFYTVWIGKQKSNAKLLPSLPCVQQVNINMFVLDANTSIQYRHVQLTFIQAQIYLMAFEDIGNNAIRSSTTDMWDHSHDVLTSLCNFDSFIHSRGTVSFVNKQMS